MMSDWLLATGIVYTGFASMLHFCDSWVIKLWQCKDIMGNTESGGFEDGN